MPSPVPHDLSLDELTDEPGLSTILYRERFGFVRREHREPRPVTRAETTQPSRQAPR